MTESSKAHRITLPVNTPVTFKGALEGDDERSTKTFSDTLGSHLGAISTHIDLTRLDGVTVATDYANEVAKIDRGVVTSVGSTRATNDGIAVGVAMTIAVLRDNTVKSHIVLAHALVRPIMKPEEPGPYDMAVQALAHECAHVEVQHRFDSAFPNLTLRPAPSTWDALDIEKWRYAIQLTFDEYAASRLSAPFGANPLSGYVEALLNTLDRVETGSRDLLRAWVIDRDFTRVLHGMLKLHGDLLIRSAYVLGTIDGLGLEPDDVSPSLRERLRQSGIEPCFVELHGICQSLMAKYGRWPDTSSFNPIGDLLEDLLASRGVSVSVRPDRVLWVDVDIPPRSERRRRASPRLR